MKICASVLVLSAVIVGQAQAGGKANLGASGFAPAHLTPATGSGDPGKSANAPGDLKVDSTTPLKDAKTLTPGSQNPNKTK
jgi:hypothetical protein